MTYAISAKPAITVVASSTAMHIFLDAIRSTTLGTLTVNQYKTIIRNMKKTLLILILFCSYLSTQAHLGEHQNNEVNSKTWYFQDKTIAAEGYFLFTKDNQVFIENKAGLVQSFKINELSWMDKNYVNRRISEI